jgi:23S rRNA pseudouridine2605 synthase
MSRRAVEREILAGRVKVNNKPAKIGMSVDLFSDVIEIDGEKVEFKASKKLYIMLNKPRGYVSSLQDSHWDRLAVNLLSDVKERVYNVGRLDKNSEGLLLFTNDGAFANKIMHPKNKVSKIYSVTVTPKATERQLVKLSSKIVLEEEELIPAEVVVKKEFQDRSVLSIKIMQGKNRQIRKMCELVGLKVVRLKRIVLGDLKLGMLKSGAYRYLTSEEVGAFDFL